MTEESVQRQTSITAEKVPYQRVYERQNDDEDHAGGPKPPDLDKCGIPGVFSPGQIVQRLLTGPKQFRIAFFLRLPSAGIFAAFPVMSIGHTSSSLICLVLIHSPLPGINLAYKRSGGLKGPRWIMEFTQESTGKTD
ncbi:hypothetical protein [Desulfomicrobium apsheronum]|uniref:hypothetical protein n=1 Tax=Desulfomicrobium apsheronum TaxID=52560 RepID=UPI00116086B9|nr:hypothetical protein [Desulfomicrobium apsheronum]